ncbi:7-carboxy-7-deazaguanine synthase QueE [Aureliella helgolandensis]|uniref:7-carboxy-7-deazaguanine synthase n=1 Tax=Aureliella helgolandensis TaxID=2527968 RepID=A0A518G1E0_9BACT|nr:7-carboxy-7-deazaguanine synthase QueE [Aureliella helgolandensis]QDV22419.1 7-carboxy-7-deazaguanine synthase [Aureliella helgolandensis]
MKSNAANRKGAKLRISEIYASIQGEGVLTGTPSIFVRTSGCNLRCWFCDTRFASWEPEGEFLELEQVVEQTLALGHSHIVLTGGEPMIYSNLPTLCGEFREAGRHITIETAGTIFHEVACDLMSISPKLSSSAPVGSPGGWFATHNARRERLEVVRQLMTAHPYQLKFVVDTPADADEVLTYLDRLGDFEGQRVLLMPQGTEKVELDRQAAWLIPWCEQHDLRFCPRAHIHWFGNRRGT